ncbi:hypothetical protein V5799_012306 [Amblyomma americanum]|uniref:M13 family peptidase n=1 Tax=Amblyomma americanum TaxID=6943 RepID=A0AAQ4EF49_AMBAM
MTPAPKISGEKSPDSRVLRADHVAFVGAVGLVSAAVCIAVPVALSFHLTRCSGSDCLSLERDMQSAMDPGADPCRDFYRYVCGGWVRSRTQYRFASFKYDAIWSQEMMRELVVHVNTEPRHRQESRDKVAILLLSALYLTLDVSLRFWMLRTNSLEDSGQLGHFLRVCAERIGVTGQSYDRMIRTVVRTHMEIKMILGAKYVASRPEFMNYSDVELRQAVNRHLPDDSQQWPKDVLVCLQLSRFAMFRDSLRDSEKAANYKEYMGAYVVWKMASFASRSITHELMAGSNMLLNRDRYLALMCSTMITAELPLAVWKHYQDKIDNASRLAIFDIYARVRGALVDAVARHDRGVADMIAKFSDTLAVSAFNMSLRRGLLEHLYRFVPRLRASGTFLALLTEVAASSMAMLKRSMLSPNTSLMHVPHLYGNVAYRLLVAREIEVPPTSLLWPLFHYRYPAAVNMALLGTLIARRLLEMVYYMFFLSVVLPSQDDEFGRVPPSLVRFPGPLKDLVEGVKRDLADGLRRTQNRTAPEAEVEDLAQVVLAGRLAYSALATVTSPKPSEYFSAMPGDRLFYMASCFKHCRWTPGQRPDLLHKPAYNVAPHYCRILRAGTILTKYPYLSPLLKSEYECSVGSSGNVNERELISYVPLSLLPTNLAGVLDTSLGCPHLISY